MGVADRFWAKVDVGAASGCWRWNGAHERISKRGLFCFEGKMQSAPRVAWAIAHGEPFPADRDACHSCDHPWCCNPDHIWPGTASENLRDAVAKGRHRTPRGDGHPKSKLTDEKVRTIRSRHAQGETQAALAREFGVAQTVIGRIVRRLSWKHVA